MTNEMKESARNVDKKQNFYHFFLINIRRENEKVLITFLLLILLISLCIRMDGKRSESDRKKIVARWFSFQFSE